VPSAAECVLTVQVYRKGKPALVKSARTDPARLYSQGLQALRVEAGACHQLG